MAYNIQTKIWSFITAYKQVTGADLHYLDLLKDKQTLIDLIDSVRAYDDASLQKSIVELEAHIKQNEIQFLHSKTDKKKRGENKKSPKTTAVDVNTIDANAQKNVNKEYAIFLKRLLANGDITIVHREELDFFFAVKTSPIKKQN